MCDITWKTVFCISRRLNAFKFDLDIELDYFLNHQITNLTVNESII